MSRRHHEGNSNSNSPQVLKMASSVHINDLPDAKDENEVSQSDISQSSYDMNQVMADMKDSQQENVRIDKLVTKLDSKNKEIERLCILLETVEMVPGADPSKYLDVLNGNDEEVV
jgi:hypothetical protein